MKTKDHYLLAKWLFAREPDRFPREFITGVFLGSVLPDWNPVTYLRGMCGGHGLHGHDAEITESRIFQLLSDFQKNLTFGFLNGLQLGTALHYLADAFTYPHHAYYSGSLADHISYETSLHHAFVEYLEKDCALPGTTTADFPVHFTNMHTLYRQCWENAHTDCRFITQMCGLVFTAALHHKRKEEFWYESPDYDRSVSAVH